MYRVSKLVGEGADSIWACKIRRTDLLRMASSTRVLRLGVVGEEKCAGEDTEGVEIQTIKFCGRESRYDVKPNAIRYL